MKQPFQSPAQLLLPGRALTFANVAEGAEGLIISDLARAVAARPKPPAVSLAVVCRDGPRLQQLARAKTRTLAVHFEYLMLDEVEQWRRAHHPGTDLHFGGNFFLARPDPTNTPALDNLGSHLLAIREYVCPSAAVTQLHCAYERPDERVVWLEKDGDMVSAINLLTHRQPIIQRFIQKVEAALNGGAAFPFDLNFALRVANAVNACKAHEAKS